MEEINENGAEIIIAGDFNLHIDSGNRPEVSKFEVLMDSFGLEVKVNGPTHISGHTLDLVITRKDCGIIRNVQISDLISDHMCISFEINLISPVLEPTKKPFRPIKNIDINSFHDDLKNSDLVTNLKDDLDALVAQFNETLQVILDKHAPKTKRSVKPRKAPWYNSEIHKQRQLRRQYTRKWRKSKSEIDKAVMISQRDLVKKLFTLPNQNFIKVHLPKLVRIAE